MQHLMTEENKKKGVEGLVRLFEDRELVNGQYMVMKVFLTAFAEATEEEKKRYTEWAKTGFLATHIPQISKDVSREMVEQNIFLFIEELMLLPRMASCVPQVASIIGTGYHEAEQLQRMWFMVDWADESLESRKNLSHFLKATLETGIPAQEHRQHLAMDSLLEYEAFEQDDEERPGEQRMDETLERLMSEGWLDAEESQGLRTLYRPVIQRARSTRQGVKAMNRDLEMLEQFQRFLSRVQNFFPKSYINEHNELILDPKENLYVRLDACKTDIDLKKGLLHFLSRPIAKSLPKSKAKKHLDALNGLLWTSFTQEDVYTIYLTIGLATNPELTEAFIASGYDLSLLKASLVENG